MLEAIKVRLAKWPKVVYFNKWGDDDDGKTYINAREDMEWLIRENARLSHENEQLSDEVSTWKGLAYSVGYID